MTPSINQKEIYQEFQTTRNNININAVAGSGKTTTLLFLLSLIPKGKTALFVAFNNTIVDELKSRTDRTDVDIMTIHSYGWRCILRHFHNVKMNPDKAIIKTAEVFQKYLAEGLVPQKKKGYYFYIVPKLIDLLRCNLLENSKENFLDLAEHHCEDIEPIDAEIAVEVFRRMEKDSKQFDFTDMIYQPNVSPFIKFKKYDYVFCDESQDFSLAQQGLINGALNRRGRLITVGDPYQCQPVGTKVLLSGNKEIDISQVKPGDQVVSYDKNGGNFTGFASNYTSLKFAKRVEDVCERFFEGNLIRVESSNNVSKYTPNHRCVVKFDENKYEGYYFVYLMNRVTKFGIDWRIGKTKLFDDNGGSFGPRVRLRTERGDQIWLLKVCSNDQEAKFWEEIYSTRYGITQKCFTCGNNDNKTFGNEKNLKLMFNLTRKFVNRRINELFKDFGLNIKYPFLTKENVKTHYSKNHMFEIFACNINLIQEVLQIMEFDNGRKKWSNITASLEPYKGWVYSLKIQDTELYVSDNILTHNCIYGFAGADENSFYRLKEMRPNSKEMPLSVCYRCAKKIVEEAQKIVPQISYSPNAPEGEVLWGDLMNVKSGDWIVCRNLKPLVQTCLWLLKNRIKSKIRGKDIGAGLLSLVIETGAKTLSGLEGAMKVKVIALEKKLRKKGIKSPSLHPKMEALLQKIEVLELLCDEVNTVSQLKAMLEDIFTEETKGILLTTIHKSKGLENDTIYFLCPELIPSKYAVLPWQLKQESNLKYVAITRAKKTLIYVPEYAFKDNLTQRIVKVIR